jgi:hypothetical protein
LLEKPHVLFYRPSTEYIEVHPCAKFFKAELSWWYRTDGGKHSYENCMNMEDAAAWRPTKQLSGGVECIPIMSDGPGPKSGLVQSGLGDCFMLYKPENGPKYSTLISPD